MSSTMWGMPIMRSMSQLTAWSAQRGPSAAAAANASAMSEEATAAMRPTRKAGQRAQEHVAAHPVGAERVRKRRGQALGGEIGRLGGRPRHETGHHNGSQQQRPAQGEREGTAAIGQPKAPRRREHGGLVGKNRISHQRPPSADAPGAYEDPPGRR